eukprot:TRINITY_DN4648_c0_g1_i1.p1 TRINITY_DN4648_c0_g1~~TRINITY_DN4648_c0_g1_i1.p1  ORF type:complete len:325 (-),score=34.68 TRINITY_DN4648_c0_g1_i1:128-1102(-)
MDIGLLLNQDDSEKYASDLGILKRRNVSKACLPCRKSHLSCDLGRPCSRCVKREISCEEGESKRRGRKKIERSETVASIVNIYADPTFHDQLKDFWLHVFFTRLSIAQPPPESPTQQTLIKSCGISPMSAMVLLIDDCTKKDSSLNQLLPSWNKPDQYPDQTQRIIATFGSTTSEIFDTHDLLVQEEVQRFQLAFENVNCPAFLFARNSQILTGNTAMRELTGFDEPFPTPFEEYRVVSFMSWDTIRQTISSMVDFFSKGIKKDRLVVYGGIQNCRSKEKDYIRGTYNISYKFDCLGIPALMLAIFIPLPVITPNGTPIDHMNC